MEGTHTLPGIAKRDPVYVLFMTSLVEDHVTFVFAHNALQFDLIDTDLIVTIVTIIQLFVRWNPCL